MGKGGAAPQAPDAYQTADAQTQMNTQTAAYNAALNRINTTTPIGTDAYNITGKDPQTGAPIYSHDVSLSPEQQQLYDQQTGQSIQAGNVSGDLLKQIGSQYSQPVSTAGLPGLKGAVDTSGLPALPGQDDLNGYRQQTQDALYDRSTQYLDPQFSQGQEQLESKLANQGVVQGSEAYNNAMSNFGATKNQAYESARNDAISGGSADMTNMFNLGSQARSQVYGEDLAGNQADNSARSQGLNELFSLREQPLTELNSLKTGNNAQLPQVQGTTPVSSNPADITGAINNQYQGQLGIYNADQQSNNATTSTVGSLALAAAMYF